MKTETINFREFLTERQTEPKLNLKRLAIVVTGAALFTSIGILIDTEVIHAAETLDDITTSSQAAETASGAFDTLIAGLLGILDPAAKIFGVIAGLAIMTGNGRIGLERLFWLSLGYLTARKVEVWIDWLGMI